MEFICISPMKLKVTLSSAECEKFGISPEGEDGDTSTLRCGLKELFVIAEERTPFRVGCEKVLVQIYPLPEGGCELFVTKLSAMGEREREAVKASGALTTYQGRDAVFRFDDFGTLLRAAGSLCRASGESDLYCDLGGAYYIRVRENLLGGLSDVDPLSEFGVRLAALPSGIEGEWGKCLIKGFAIPFLKRLVR